MIIMPADSGASLCHFPDPHLLESGCDWGTDGEAAAHGKTLAS
jgi:hypothetical protein